MVVEKPLDTKAIITELVRRINEDSRRIRSLEQRISRTDNSISSLEDTSLTQLNDLKVRFEKINNDINLITEKLFSIENEILKFNKELTKAAKKTELKQIETFIDLINPIKSRFVTIDQIENIIEEKLIKKKS